MLDNELMKEISREFKDIPHTFISSVSGQGIVTLKDEIWKLLNS